ncbi:isochorismate synthase [uncultured Georgenia sp.]|uniref:isochorismate synthase n=1 Tax=uncultured Georgenia sp. TaxID=378209 RepID=UPI002627CF9B|nr:isochorismate synthase [uncultured Georgenia sp.]HLV03975.1 isochorismate synthase [Actinomycetaceae bacterium]
MSTAPAGEPARSPLLARTVPIPDPGDLLDLLPRPDAASTVSWVRRGDGLVGWGVAARVDTRGETRMADADTWWRTTAAAMVVRDEVRLPGTGPVAFGSFSFSRDSAAGGTLVVPQVVVGRRDGRSWLTVVGPAGLGPTPTLAQSRGDVAAVTAPGDVEFSDGALTSAQWQRAVAEVIGTIRTGAVEKVVMARDVVAHTARDVDVRHLLRNLAAEYPTCWTFAVDALVGATPELLVRRDQGLVACRVLAGTIQRTGDDAADLRHAAELARSSKDLGEHELAVESVAEALAPYCSSFNVPESPFVLHLPNVMHLASDVTGVVDRSSPDAPSSLALAAALHPTAAVGGTPTAAAVEVLAAAERMDRARYAAPVGWMGADGDGEWGIALRSGEVTGPRTVRLFAGCGIVAASDPAAEARESEAKLRPMRSALTS